MTSNFQEPIIDHFNGRTIKYPADSSANFLKFDFFRKKGADTWRYINSFNEFNELVENQKMAVLDGGGEYCIVDCFSVMLLSVEESDTWMF